MNYLIWGGLILGFISVVLSAIRIKIESGSKAIQLFYASLILTIGFGLLLIEYPPVIKFFISLLIPVSSVWIILLFSKTK